MEDDRGRLQVLKLITDVADDAPALAARLEQVRATLPQHPALLPITEVGTSEEGVYIASPVLNAPTVEGRLRGGRQTLEATLPWLRAVTAGLQAAHDAGVWHGALHPRDVLVTEEGGVVTGVGVAPALESLKLQAPVRVPFTAPERASGRAWDARADQYSLAMLALDALSGRRLIAGTIPAFDRWTLAETPTEDARLHEVFVRSLHPDPDQRYASVEEWLTALAGTERADEAGALSRFAREGVILAAAASAAEPGRDIKVQTIEDPDGVALSLFPEEDGTTESPVVEISAAETEVAPVPGADAEAEQEWLVAEVPEQGAPGERDADAFGMRHDPVLAATEASDSHGPEWRLDDEDRPVTAPEPVRTWDTSADDSPSRGPWLVMAVLLVMAALGYGTWQSLQGPAPSSSTDAVQSGPTPETAPSSEAPATEPPASPRSTPAPAPPASSATSAPVPTPPKSVSQAPVTAARPAAPATPVVPPARQPSAPAVAASPTSAGRVLIRSSPSAEVRVNGAVRGETPVVLRDLPFGQYLVSITRPGFEPVEREVTLLASQPVASLSVDLVRAGAAPGSGAVAPATSPATTTVRRPTPPEPPSPATPAPAGSGAATPAPVAPAVTAAAAPTGGIFVVSTPSQARLFVDGQPYGSTPAGIPGLTQGAHTVRVEAPGYKPWEGRVAVIAGTRVRVQATLQQEQE